MLALRPITLTAARQFVDEFHRHHKAPQGGLFAVAVEESGELAGVAIVGRPVARHQDDGWTAEVTRLCTNGAKNACSMLYAACWRAARALGYQRLITYILASESGVTLKASGWRVVGQTKGGSWNRPSRIRIDKHPTEQKTIWQITNKHNGE